MGVIRGFFRGVFRGVYSGGGARTKIWTYCTFGAIIPPPELTSFSACERNGDNGEIIFSYCDGQLVEDLAGTTSLGFTGKMAKTLQNSEKFSKNSIFPFIFCKNHFFSPSFLPYLPEKTQPKKRSSKTPFSLAAPATAPSTATEPFPKLVRVPRIFRGGSSSLWFYFCCYYSFFTGFVAGGRINSSEKKCYRLKRSTTESAKTPVMWILMERLRRAHGSLNWSGTAIWRGEWLEVPMWPRLITRSGCRRRTVIWMMLWGIVRLIGRWGLKCKNVANNARDGWNWLKIIKIDLYRPKIA